MDSLSSLTRFYGEERVYLFLVHLNAYLKGKGVTSFFITVTQDSSSERQKEHDAFSSVTDNILLLRYVEMDGTLKSFLTIVKARGSSHSKGLYLYSMGKGGLSIQQSLSGYEGVITGVSRKVSKNIRERLVESFTRYLGPITPTIFQDLEKGGFTMENLLTYLDSIFKRGIIDEESKSSLEREIKEIFASEVH